MKYSKWGSMIRKSSTIAPSNIIAIRSVGVNSDRHRERSLWTTLGFAWKFSQ